MPKIFWKNCTYCDHDSHRRSFFGDGPERSPGVSGICCSSSWSESRSRSAELLDWDMGLDSIVFFLFRGPKIFLQEVRDSSGIKTPGWAVDGDPSSGEVCSSGSWMWGDDKTSGLLVRNSSLNSRSWTRIIHLLTGDEFFESGLGVVKDVPARHRCSKSSGGSYKLQQEAWIINKDFVFVRPLIRVLKVDSGPEEPNY